MSSTTVAVGSLEGLRSVLSDASLLRLEAGADVVVVPTAAAFVGIAEAAWAVAEVCEPFDLRVEALMVADRTSAGEPYFAERLGAADLVVLCDGSPLHARAVWRATPVGEGIDRARRLLAVGSVASVLGAVMIDPRGGAPTTGLGYRDGVAFAAPASDEQLARTRSLMPAGLALAVLGPRGVVLNDGAAWRVVIDDVVVTRGHDVALL
jgi:hypothetical protein